MAKQLFSNNATTTLSAAITNVATSISVVTGKGALFASPTSGDYELLTITDGTNYEIVKCTARSTDTLTVTRAQESTTARAWSAGATIAGYVTKGTLEELRMQGAGSNAVLIGGTATSTGDRSVAVGHSADATANYATAVGVNSTASAAGSIAIGDNAKSSGQYGISLGTNSHADVSAIAMGNTCYADALGPTWLTRVQSTAYAVGDFAVYDSNHYMICCKSGTTSGSSFVWGGLPFESDGGVVWHVFEISADAISAGANTKSVYEGVAIGKSSLANIAGVSVGTGAIATNNAVALGKYNIANHANSIVIGSDLVSMSKFALHTGKLPFLGTPPSWMFGSEYQNYAACEGYLHSEPIDLSGGAAWASTTAVKHGYVVKPVTPNGKQYVRYCNNYDPWRNPILSSYSEGSTGNSEPTWPTTFGDSVSDGDGSWICIPHDGTYVLSLPTDAYMMVSEVGFIAYDVDTITVQPYVSIGTGGGDLTSLVNNQQTSGLTADMTVYKWTLTQPKLVQNLSIKIDTLATATRLLGRFYFKGVLTKHWV